MRKIQYLILDDVDGLGRSGELVDSIKPGFLRNYLLPKQKVMRAGPHTIKRQEKLQEVRKIQAKVDLEESLKLAEKLKNITLEIEVEVNNEGDMYGSVSVVEILQLLEQKGFSLERKMIRLGQPIKKLGEHAIPLKLKENVDATCQLNVKPKGGLSKKESLDKPESQNKSSS